MPPSGIDECAALTAAAVQTFINTALEYGLEPSRVGVITCCRAVLNSLLFVVSGCVLLAVLWQANDHLLVAVAFSGLCASAFLAFIFSGVVFLGRKYVLAAGIQPSRGDEWPWCSCECNDVLFALITGVQVAAVVPWFFVSAEPLEDSREAMRFLAQGATCGLVATSLSCLAVFPTESSCTGEVWSKLVTLRGTFSLAVLVLFAILSSVCRNTPFASVMWAGLIGGSELLLESFVVFSARLYHIEKKEQSDRQYRFSRVSV